MGSAKVATVKKLMGRIWLTLSTSEDAVIETMYPYFLEI